MNEKEKQIMKPIIHINGAFYFVLSIIWVTSLNDGYFSLNLAMNTALTVGSLVAGAIYLLYGIRAFNKVKEKINVSSSLKYFELVPNIVGFALISVGAAVTSIYKSINQPHSIPPFYTWHPYSFQGFTLYLAGSLTLMLSYFMYQRLIPKQIIKHCKFCGSENSYDTTFCHRCGQNILRGSS